MRDDNKVILAFIGVVALVLLIVLAEVFINASVDTERMRVCLEAYTSDTARLRPMHEPMKRYRFSSDCGFGTRWRVRWWLHRKLCRVCQ